MSRLARRSARAWNAWGALAMPEKRYLAGPVGGMGKGSEALAGWPADVAERLRMRALEVLLELTKQMPSEVIPIASAIAVRNAGRGDPKAAKEVQVEQRARAQAPVAASVAAAAAAAAMPSWRRCP
jgi:hypothetical protein